MEPVAGAQRGLLRRGPGPDAPVTILEVEADNAVCCLDDVADPAKKATSAAPAPYTRDVRHQTFTFALMDRDRFGASLAGGCDASEAAVWPG